MRKAKGSTEASGRANRRGDAQKTKIYAWEDSHPEFSRNTLTLLDCQYAISHACALYRVTPPRVTVHYDDYLSYSQTAAEDDAVISLQGWAEEGGYAAGGMNLATCLHEAAHHIQSIKYARSSDHGYVFAGIYMNLLLGFHVLPWDIVAAEWRKFGVRCRR